MAQCEMCGREAELSDAIVEGCILSVCDNCAKYGNIVAIKKPVHVPKPSPKTHEKEPELIVSDCAAIVKKAREKKGLTQQQLAKAIAEKESMIHRIEAGKARPTLKTALKLGQFLGINLIESYEPEEEQEKQIDLRDTSLTIGDLIKMKKSKE